MNLREFIARGPPPGGVDQSDAPSYTRAGAVADWLEAMMRRRGYEPLTPEFRNTLWLDYQPEISAMLPPQAKSAFDAEAIAEARDYVADRLP